MKKAKKKNPDRGGAGVKPGDINVNAEVAVATTGTT